LANTKSAEKAARQSTVHRARNDALTSQLRSAIRKATLALKAGKQDEAASALAAATPVIDSMVNKGIIHRNKAARQIKSRDACLKRPPITVAREFWCPSSARAPLSPITRLSAARGTDNRRAHDRA
jgi:small subunit ribosomal protein S20